MKSDAVLEGCKLRVLCLSVYPECGPSLRHRVCAYRTYWRQAGVELALKPLLTEALYLRRRRFGGAATAYKVAMFAWCTLRLVLRLTTLRRYDAVIIHREVFPLGGAFFERLVARLNPNTVFDVDDAIWAPMPLAVDQRRGLRDPHRVADSMSVCRAVVAGNDYLAEYARQFCKDVVIVPTPCPDLGGDASRRRPESARPIIVWIGNVGNEEYLGMLAQPLARLARRFDFTLRVIGSPEARYLRMEGVQIEVREWNEQQERQWLVECAIGVMPLPDREYERGKCAFKLVQYFSAGLPVVASPVGMNAEVVRDGENGYLAYDEEGWYQALATLLGDSALRRRLGAQGYALYCERFTPERNAGDWLRLLRRICSHSTNPTDR